MQTVLLQAAILIVCGTLWRVLRPGGLDPQQLRKAIGDLVYFLLLPALVLSVLWSAPLGADSARIALLAASGVLAGLAVAAVLFRVLGTPRASAGALVLAAGFPNATYLGLPVLESTLGPWARSIAIQYDLFACTPLLLSLGILIAQRYGEARREPPARFLVNLLKVPPLWAATVAVILNLSAVPTAPWFAELLNMLGRAVIPLMLFSLGLSLSWDKAAAHRLPLVLPVVAIQLLLTPLLVWWLAVGMGLEGGTLLGVVLEAAMPPMVLGLVLCDRYGLDTGLYAVTVTLGTALSVVTLPLWMLIAS